MGQNQVHDFNPGITTAGHYDQNGVFWTMPIPDDDVEADLHDATAAMHANNLPMPDYHDIINSLGFNGIPPSYIQGQVSFTMNWTGKGSPTTINDQTNQFAGTFIDSNATIAWSASEPHFTYVSDPASMSTPVSGVIGRERNGIFYRLSNDDSAS